MKLTIYHIALLLFLLCITVLSIWLLIVTNQIKTRSNSAQNPESFVTNPRIVRTNEFGQPQNILTAQKMQSYQNQERITFEKPFLTIHKPHAAPWHIQSDLGESRKQMKEILLTGNVSITQLPGLNSQNVTVLTSELLYYPDKSFATTDKPVTIKRPEGIAHGIGMHADLQKETVTLLSKTTAQYVTSQKSRAK